MGTISLRKVGVNAAEPLFSNLDFTIGDNDRLALVAGNGRGKTTLMRCLAGLAEPSTGDIVRSRGLTVAVVEQDEAARPQLHALGVVADRDIGGAGDADAEQHVGDREVLQAAAGADAVTLQRGDVTLATRAHFEATARVLSREDYRFDAGAALAPTDLALGWGRMSDSGVLDRIEITQSGRFYYWRVKDFPIPRREIEESSANMHIIPADAGVRAMLDRVRPGELVHLEGFLVDARRADGWRWNTSLTREDTGNGACELVFVESLTVEP